jgi:hypothetical protein
MMHKAQKENNELYKADEESKNPFKNRKCRVGLKHLSMVETAVS